MIKLCAQTASNLECGDLSPLLPLWRLVAKAGPRPAARACWTRSRIRRRQVACRKRGQVRALQSGCGSAALGLSVFICRFHSLSRRNSRIQKGFMNKMLCLCSLLAVTVALGCKPQAKVSDAPAAAKPAPAVDRSGAAEPAPDVLLVKEVSLPTQAPDLGTSNAPLTEGDKAWMELLKAMEPPVTPAEWDTVQPSPEVLNEFQRTNAIFLALAADKARQFYTKYADHAMADEAREREHFLLTVAAQLGNTNVAARLEALDELRLKDPKLTEDERFELRLQQIERVLSQDGGTVTGAVLDKMEASVRALQKEFTNRTELAALLLTPAEGRLNNNEPGKARALAVEVADASAEPEVQEASRALLKKINRIGKPLELKFKAVDGREVELQAMK